MNNPVCISFFLFFILYAYWNQKNAKLSQLTSWFWFLNDAVDHEQWWGWSWTVNEVSEIKHVKRMNTSSGSGSPPHLIDITNFPRLQNVVHGLEYKCAHFSIKLNWIELGNHNLCMHASTTHRFQVLFCVFATVNEIPADKLLVSSSCRIGSPWSAKAGFAMPLHLTYRCK